MPEPKLPISIIGLEDYTEWPELDSIEHEQPTGDVIVNNVEPGSYIEVIYGSQVTTLVENDGTIIIDSGLLTNAIDRMVRLVLYQNNTKYGGYIKFLPWSESEEWLSGDFINESGALKASSSYSYTDYIDISEVIDIIYSGQAVAGARAMACYDENKRFVRLLLETGTFNNVHIVPDGTYKYIRACSTTSYNKSLIVYFRTRG